MIGPKTKSHCCPVCGNQTPPLQGLTLIADRGRVCLNGTSVSLSRSKFLVLEKLARHAPSVVSKWALYESVYPHGRYEVEQKIIDVFICSIRKTVAPLGLSIKVSWGQGYSLEYSGAVVVISEVVDEA